MGGFRSSVAIAFGILLPAWAMCVEIATHTCASAFFDPLPTVWHILVFAMVPVGNLVAFLLLRPGRWSSLTAASIASGVALGVALVYSVLFLPILPLSVIAIPLAGIGLCGLAPEGAALAAAPLVSELRRRGGQATVRPWLAGVVLGVALIAGIELPALLTQGHVREAASPDVEVRRRGLEWLRAHADRDTLLDLCRERRGQGRQTFMFAWLRQPTTDEAREAYFRVTGRPFNAVDPEGRFLLRLDRPLGRDEDFGQGNLEVGDRIEGVSLKESSIEARVEAEGGVAAMQWTLLFHNASEDQAEARVQIALPRQGVVNNLVLWINGQEREAAFGGRKRAQAAYQEVVQKQRDPALVTTSGPDRVLLQCFPIPRRGEMKVRLHLAAPVVVRSGGARLRLPCMVGRNFAVGSALRHRVVVRSQQALTGPSALASTREGSETVLSGGMSDSDLLDARTAISTGTPSAVAWCPDSREPRKAVIQRRDKTRPFTPRHVWVVVDGSASMAPHLPDVARALRRWPADLATHVILATQERGGEGFGMVDAILREGSCVGGQDSLPALAEACNRATTGEGGGAVVWIHGPQPLVLGSAEAMQERLRSRSERPLLYDVEVEPGPERLLEGLEESDAVVPVPRVATLGEDLEALAAEWKGSNPSRVIREVVPRRGAVGTRTLDALQALWVSDRVRALLATGSEPKRREALVLAAHRRVVTPVTGAVVLESEEMYKRAGLRNLNADDIPGLPEPRLGAILLVLLAVGTCWAGWRRLRTRAA